MLRSHLQRGPVCIHNIGAFPVNPHTEGKSFRSGISVDALKARGSAQAFPGFQDSSEGVDGFGLNTQSQLGAIQEKGN